MMRLLFLTDSFRPSRSACANRACVLVDAMREAGIDVQVLASSDSLLNSSGGYTKPDYVTFFETFPPAGEDAREPPAEQLRGPARLR